MTISYDHHEGAASRREPLFGVSGPTPAALAELRKHPRFADAMRVIASETVALYQGNRILNTLVNDRGRMLIGYFSLYLHYSRHPDDPESGLTVSRLKALCVEQGVCSPGRAEAILIVMRLFGYVELAPAGASRRSRQLVPTERLVASLQTRWKAVFAAMALVLPEGNAAQAALRMPEFTPALVGSLTEQFLRGFRILDSSAELGLFADRNAGLMVLFSLLLAGATNDSFPPKQPVSISLSALSRRFGVSRVHVRKLLRDAAGEGFLKRHESDEGLFTVQPVLAEATETFFATILLFVGDCIGKALDDIGFDANTVKAAM